MFTVQIKIMPLKDLLDPQGKAIQEGLKNLGIGSVADVRTGKHLTIKVDAKDKQEARGIAEEASKKLLANPVMETYEIVVE